MSRTVDILVFSLFMSLGAAAPQTPRLILGGSRPPESPGLGKPAGGGATLKNQSNLYFYIYIYILFTPPSFLF